MTNNVLIVNSDPGYPNPIAVSRYFRDARAAADVRQLAWVVLCCTTDCRLHYSATGTAIVLQPMAQATLWNQKEIDTAPLTALIQPLNRWMLDRTRILKGKRALDKRIAKSDEMLDEFGYPDLGRVLLNLASGKNKMLQILDPSGQGGILQVPPRGHLIPARKSDEPALSGDSEEVLHIKHITQLIDPSGTLIEAPTARVSTRVVEGGHAYIRRPHKASVKSRRAKQLSVIRDNEEHGNEKT